jgi:hypothetical protein
MNDQMLLARRRILLAKQSRKAPDMVLLINSTNTGDFSVTTNYGTFTAVKVSEYPYFGTTVTHKLSISDVTFSTGRSLSSNSAVRGLFVGVESWGTSNTYTNTYALFNSCTSLRGIPSSWEGLGAVTNATEMFWGCTSLTSIPTSWEGLGELTNSTSMFRECTSLTSIPTSWEGLGELTTAIGMFSRCTSLTNCGTIFTGLAWVTNVNSLFYRCTGMQGDIQALYVYLSTKPIAVSNYSYCFGSCTQAVGYSSIPASWK